MWQQELAAPNTGRKGLNNPVYKGLRFETTPPTRENGWAVALASGQGRQVVVGRPVAVVVTWPAASHSPTDQCARPLVGRPGAAAVSRLTGVIQMRDLPALGPSHPCGGRWITPTIGSFRDLETRQS